MLALLATLALASYAPGDGAALAPAPSVAFDVQTSQPAPGPVRVEIATAPRLASDGTLAERFTVESLTLAGSGRGDSLGGWAGEPGTYYWQAISGDARSDVHAFTVTGVPSRARFFPFASARRTVGRIIRANTGHRPRITRRDCTRVDATAFHCEPLWTDRRFVWALSLEMTRNGDEVRYSATGVRAGRRCLRHRPVAACAQPVRW